MSRRLDAVIGVVVTLVCGGVVGYVLAAWFGVA